MANKSKQRYIDTKFWSDGFITELDPLERYLFIYLLTNEHTNICGIYELPLRVMAFESGIDKEMLPKMLSRFAGKVGKIEYINGWVCIRNFIKHQASENVKIKTGIIEKLKEVPKEIIDVLIGFKYPINTLLIGYTYPSNNTNTDKDTNTNTNLDIVSGDKSPTPKENAVEFFKEVELLKTGKKK